MADLAGVMVGNYFLLECLDSEGIVATYRARPTTRGGCDVLLRIFRPTFPDPTGFRDHFMDEVDKVWKCRHEYIQPLIEFGAGDGLLYSVSEMVEAETLAQYLERWEREHGSATLPVPLIARWTTQLCEALTFAHEHGIAHGNIQPSSILLRGDDTLLLTNFGMKQISQDMDAGVALVDEGNAAYYAPEQAVGILTPACDIYAVGILLYRLFTGKLPYDGADAGEIALHHADDPIPSPRLLCPDMPETVEMVIRVALAKTPQARFPSHDSLARALLAALVKDEPPPVDVPRQTITPRRRVQGRKGYAGQPPSIWSRVVTITSILVVLAGFVGIMLFFTSVPFRLQDFHLLPLHLPSGPNSVNVGPGSSPTPVATQPGHHRVPGGGNAASSPTTGTTVIPLPGFSPTPSPSMTPTIPTTSGNPACATGTLSVDGSPYLAPILTKVSQDYASNCPDLQVTLRSDGTRALNYVQSGRIAIADSDLSAIVSRNLVDHPIAALLFTLIVNPDVGLNGLSSADIQGIYAGQITNWKQIGGPDERIIVLYPPATASINGIFRAFVLNNTQPQAPGYTLRKDNPSQTAQLVAQTPGAISFVPLETVQAANAPSVQALAIDGVSAGAQALISGAYPFWSVEHLYTSGFGSSQAQAWMQFIAQQQENAALMSAGAVPVAMLSPGMLLSHLPGPQV